MLSKRDIADAVFAWKEEHGRFPRRASVAPEVADFLSGDSSATLFTGWRRFGSDTLAVTEWYVDPTLSQDDIRLEA